MSTIKANAIIDAAGGNTATINGTLPASVSATQTLTNKTLTAPIITGNLGAGGASYGTSGQVLTSAGTGASPAWSSTAFGSTVVTAKSRASGTSYQNTTSGWLFVAFAGANNGTSATVGATAPGNSVTINSSNATQTGGSFMVPPGYYYIINYSVLNFVSEGQA